MNPWITFTLDAAIVGFGVASYQREKTLAFQTNGKRVFAQTVASFVVVVTLGAISFGGERSVTLTSADQTIPVGASVALLPEQWLNAKFPLSTYCQVEVDLSSGRYAVMLRRRRVRGVSRSLASISDARGGIECEIDSA
ncbi:MAG: hypothetical protein IJU03_12635 [Thermoguttaceae bacterium]|nr:hypothetical protein [Thermoguttaceae bacterium]